jgi:iron complex outermembrane receptor protein
MCGLRYFIIQFGFRVRRLGLLSSAALCLSTIVQAEDTLKTITVTDDPIPETGEVQHEEYTGSHKRITKNALERQDVNLGDILAQESGVQFRQVGGVGTLTTVTMRGGSSRQTGVYLDGILINSGGNATVDLSLFEILNLENVDIYRGASPLQLSAGSIGGAINMRTLSGQKQQSGSSVVLGGGSFNTRRVQFAGSTSYKRWDVVAAASRVHSDNNFSFINNNGTPLNPNDDKRELRNNAAASQVSALARTGYQWNSKTRSDIMLQTSARQLGIPEWLNNKNNEASYDTESYELQLNNRFDGIGNWNSTLSFFQHSQDNHYLDIRSQVGLGAQDAKTDSLTQGVKTYWEHIGDSGTFGLSTSVRNETFNSIDTIAPNQDYEVERVTVLGNLQFAGFFMDDKLLLTPTINFQYSDEDYTGSKARPDTARNNSNIGPQLGLRYSLNNTTQLRANVGRYYRQPAFSELFGGSGLILGNSNLKPEYGLNADIGFSYKPSDKHSVDVTVFTNNSDDLIVLAFDSRGIGRSVNTGKTNVTGIEISNTAVINRYLSARVNATYQRSYNYSPTPALNKKQLPGESALSAHASVQYKKANKRFWLETNGKSDFYYDQANLLPGKNHWLFNAGADWQYQTTRFSFTVNNIGNDNVQDFNGFPRPGRAFYFSMTHKF